MKVQMPKQLSHNIRAWILDYWFLHIIPFAFRRVCEAPKNVDVLWLLWKHWLRWNTQVYSPATILEKYECPSLGCALRQRPEVIEQPKIPCGDCEGL